MGVYTQGNDTYACSDADCLISCASPEFGSNICYSMQQNFLDGTSCQGGGRCNNGDCRGSSVGKEISSWINKNRTLVIALASVIGGLFILAVLSCCWSRIRKHKRAAKRQASMPSQPPPGWNGSRQEWQRAPPAYSYGHVPNYNPNSRSNVNGVWENGRWNPTAPPTSWQPSVRYA